MATEYILLLQPSANLDEVEEMLTSKNIEILEKDKSKVKVKIPAEDNLALLDQLEGVINVLPV